MQALRGCESFCASMMEYITNVMMGGSGSGNAPIPIRYLIDGAYLDLVRREMLQHRLLNDILETDLLTALRHIACREASARKIIHLDRMFEGRTGRAACRVRVAED